MSPGAPSLATGYLWGFMRIDARNARMSSDCCGHTALPVARHAAARLRYNRLMITQPVRTTLLIAAVLMAALPPVAGWALNAPLIAPVQAITNEHFAWDTQSAYAPPAPVMLAQ